MKPLLLVFRLALLLCCIGAADAAVRIDGKTAETRLNGCASVLEDASGKLALADVLQPDNSRRFVARAPGRMLHLGLSQSAWWLRCDLDVAPAAVSGKLEAGLPYLDQVDVHFVRNQSVIASYASGDQRPFTSRNVVSHRLIFPLPDTAGEMTMYIRVQSSSLVTVPLRWLSDAELDRVNELDLIVLAGFWGVLFALSIYNLFLFFAVRAWSFLHYVLSSVSYSLALSCVLGFGARYLWPEGTAINNDAVIVLLFASGAFGLCFAASFFSTAKRTPRTHRWLIATAAIEIGGIALTLASTRAGELLIGLTSNVAMVLMFMVAWRGIRDRLPGARPFTVAIIVQFLVTMSQTLQSTGIVALEYWTSYSLQMGAACMAMLHALGIAVRLNAIKRAKEDAQAQALAAQQMLVESLRENERILESRVEQRTQELAEVNSVLRQREQQLVNLLHHDTLTGVATRILFEDRLRQAMARCTRSERLVALLLIDLDGFKTVNDTYGHDAGDAVLVEIARRFTAAVRTTDTVGRLGGDEFIVILDDLKSPEDARRVAAKIVAEAALPIAFKEHALKVGASIGIALCPLDATEPAALIKVADGAMYRAKEAGRGCWKSAG